MWLIRLHLEYQEMPQIVKWVQISSTFLEKRLQIQVPLSIPVVITLMLRFQVQIKNNMFIHWDLKILKAVSIHNYYIQNVFSILNKWKSRPRIIWYSRKKNSSCCNKTRYKSKCNCSLSHTSKKCSRPIVLWRG